MSVTIQCENCQESFTHANRPVDSCPKCQTKYPEEIANKVNAMPLAKRPLLITTGLFLSLFWTIIMGIGLAAFIGYIYSLVPLKNTYGANTEQIPLMFFLFLYFLVVSFLIYSRSRYQKISMYMFGLIFLLGSNHWTSIVFVLLFVMIQYLYFKTEKVRVYFLDCGYRP